MLKAQTLQKEAVVKAEPTKKLTRILMAVNRQLVRNAFTSYFCETDDLELLCTVKSVEDALADAVNLKPDITILSLCLNGEMSFDIARKIKEQSSQSKIVFLSAFFEDSWIEQALALQAAGCLTEDEPGEAVVRAMREIANGGKYFSLQVKTRIVIESTGVKLAHGLRSPIDMLTARELEVLQYIAWGKPKKDIAHILKLSLNTISRHTSNLMTKLGIRDRVQLARFAIREGLIEA